MKKHNSGAFCILLIAIASGCVSPGPRTRVSQKGGVVKGEAYVFFRSFIPEQGMMKYSGFDSALELQNIDNGQKYYLLFPHGKKNVGLISVQAGKYKIISFVFSFENAAGIKRNPCISMELSPNQEFSEPFQVQIGDAKYIGDYFVNYGSSPNFDGALPFGDLKKIEFNPIDNEAWSTIKKNADPDVNWTKAWPLKEGFSATPKFEDCSSPSDCRGRPCKMFKTFF